MLSRYLVLACVAFPSAPAMAQWVLTHEKEDVVVDGATYRVNWQTKDGELISGQTVTNPFIHRLH